jgi:Tetratricopeptide repeat
MRSYPEAENLRDDHRHTIGAVVNLAATLRSQGNYSAARAMFEDALIRSRRTLGDDYPDTIAARKTLADLDLAR